ncbi:hypothetical protein [Aeribacillus pallidus]|uniref:hypothetical protein n=1 Tax=Aeribacillus pallidus TaxID=33936 RepID=UPI003D253A4E
MRFFLGLFRAVLISVNLVLLNFIPNTDNEIKMFFASRLVFFLMLIIDYANVAYYNRSIERGLGIIGVLISLGFAIIEGLAFSNLFTLSGKIPNLILVGNPNNMLMSKFGSFSLEAYVFTSWLFVAILLGLEVFNHGIRSTPIGNKGYQTKPIIGR